jgi:polyisoprenoid-binding protein YceI
VARYRVLPERSKLWVDARSSLHPIRVESSALSGAIELELADGNLDLSKSPSGTLELEAESLKTGNRLEDSQLQRQLEVRKFPRIRGQIRQVSANGGRYHVRGDLSLHGVTKPIEGDVMLRAIDDVTVEVEGEKVIDLRDFGLQPPRILMLKVYPEVKVRAKVVAAREG